MLILFALPAMNAFGAKALSTNQATALQIKVSGTVVSENDGKPMPGVSVMVKGTRNGTITDINGKYSISVQSADAVLLFSFLGYLKEEKAVSGQSVIDVSLIEDIKNLDEVVVIGYGTQKKSDVTGAVAKVGASDLKNRSTSDAAVALQGKAAGVQILSNSGAPGKGADIRVRGMSSNSDKNGPLMIVDGLKVDNIQYLDPEMIESMEVLKDAASAAIYGAQAGNGVILITTKSGSKSKDGQIFYNAQWQLSSLSRKLKVMNAQQYIDFGKQQGFLSDARLTSVGYVPGTDINWADEVFEPTWNSRHTIGFQGGNDRGSYFLATNIVSNNGIFKGNKDIYDRLSLQVNGDYKVKPWLTVGTNNSIEKWKTKTVSQQSDNGSALLAAITSDPLFGPYCETDADLTQRQKDAIANGITVLKGTNGKYYRLSPISGESQSANPFIQRDAVDGYNEGINVRGLSYLNFNPIKGLVYTSRLGYRIEQSNSHSYQFPFEANEFVRRTTYNISAAANTSYYYQFENFINYNTTIASKHEIAAMAGMSWEENHSDNVSASSDGADILTGYESNYHYLDYLKTDAKVTANNAPNDARSLSYFGRLSYNYDNRYNIQANLRADAFDSSKLPKDSRWGYFPSVSAGWTISNESFVKDNISENVLSNLKLRGSWGRNGNISVLSGYPYSGVISSNSDFYQYTPGSSALSYGSVPDPSKGLPNPDLVWEKSEQVDLGLDARLLKGRLSFGVDYYNKETKGLLVNVTPVIETGVGTTTLNAGNVTNKGLEIEIGWKDKLGDLTYSVNANFATLKNELTYLDPIIKKISGVNLQGSNITTQCTQGAPLWYFYGYKFKAMDAQGNATFQDIDGNGVWDSNDKTNLGSGLPTYNYGITINLEYKGFDLSVFGTGAGGNKILPQAWRTDRPYNNNYSWFYENSWTSTHTDARFPAVSKWSKDAYSSDLTIFNGDYFKIKQIQLGYTLPKNITSKIRISNLRVFGSLENFFTFTKYIGLDPEAASANNSSSLGIDMGTYPTAKQIVLGVNLSF
jgi:TonB-linked SusC/RagA family outer membrane protein